MADPSLLRYEAISALADRDYDRADQILERAGRQDASRAGSALQLRVLTLVLGGRKERAAELIRGQAAASLGGDLEGWTWLSQSFGLPEPAGMRPASSLEPLGTGLRREGADDVGGSSSAVRPGLDVGHR